MKPLRASYEVSSPVLPDKEAPDCICNSFQQTGMRLLSHQEQGKPWEIQLSGGQLNPKRLNLYQFAEVKNNSAQNRIAISLEQIKSVIYTSTIIKRKIYAKNPPYFDKAWAK